MVKKVLTPSLLGNIARTVVSSGAAMYLIEVMSGEIKLRPIGSWDISGSGADPSSWYVRGDIYSPSSNDTVYVGYNSVIHVMHHYSEARPWLGLSGMDSASTTAALAAAIETRLKQEAASPSGYFLPWPTSPDDNDVDEDTTTPGEMVALKQDIAAAKGGLVVTESVAGGHGDRQAAPQKDLQQVRFGMDSPDSMRALRSDVTEMTAGVLGVPPPILRSDSNSQAQREAWRRFILSSCTGLARKISQELSVKLETEIRLTFENLYAHDQMGRSAALSKMVQSGMPLEQAVTLSGVLISEEGE